MLIEGSPGIYSKIEGGIHGDIATASMTVNSIPAVLAATPGFGEWWFAEHHFTDYSLLASPT